MNSIPPLSPDSGPAPDEIDLRVYAQILYRWRYSIGAWVVAAIFASSIFTFFQVPLYIAKVTILPEEKSAQPNFGALGGLAASFGVAVPAQETPASLYGDILKSRDFLKEFRNDSLPTQNNPKGISVKEFLGIQVQDPESVAVALSGILGGMIELKEEGNITILSVNSKDPVFSAGLANDLIFKLEEYNREKRISKLKRNRSFVEERLDEIEKEVKSARDRLSTFRQKNMRIDVGHAPYLLDEQEWLLQEVKTKSEIYVMLKKEYEMARIEEEKDKPLIQVLDHAIPPSPIFKPAKKMLMAASIVLSLFVGIFMSFVLEFCYTHQFIPARFAPWVSKIRR